VFEPYFTTKRSGLGIGLALSLKTVAAHRGTIEAASQAGHGATFTVVLPTEAAHG
jgi:two-component system sensor histidine kinase HydH